MAMNVASADGDEDEMNSTINTTPLVDVMLVLLIIFLITIPVVTPAVFAMTQAAGARAMIPARYGRIINIASVAGLFGTSPDFMRTIAYNTSKGGLVNFTRSLAAEWAQYNITVNAIAPGVFPTKMAKAMAEQNSDMILRLTPMRRFGRDEDLKGVAVLLASDASGYITGQTIAVDGGMSAI